MRERGVTSIASLVLSASLWTASPAADGEIDLSCAWREFSRRPVLRGIESRLRARGTLDVACDGTHGPRRIAVSLYASADGSVAEGARALVTKRVRPRPGGSVRVAFDAAIPFGAAARFVVARVDDADEAAERDETNNLAAQGPLLTGEEYAPLEEGNQWRYAGTRSSGGRGPVAYSNSVADEGEHVVGDVVAHAIASSNSRNTGTRIVEYLQRDERGVVDWGNDDESDWITRRIAPFRALAFPFDAPYRYTSVARHGLAYPDDVDRDGRLERLDATQRVRFLGLEDVELPVGRFANCAHLRTRASATVTLSRSGTAVRVVGTQDQWFAPAIGPVRIVERYTGPGVRETTEETLTGALTASSELGYVHGLAITSTSSTWHSGSPAVASDGSVALVVFTRTADAGDTHGLVGAVVSPRGVVLREFRIADFPVDNSGLQAPTVAYGAGQFVVAYRRAREPLHLRAVTEEGVFLWEAEVPFATDTYGAFALAFDGAGFLLLWGGTDMTSVLPSVTLTRVSPAGSLSAARLISNVYGGFGGVAVGCDGSNALCAWSDGSELLAMRVSPAGEPLESMPLRLAAAPYPNTLPAVAGSPEGGWLVAWTNSTGTTSRVRRTPVSADGVIASPEGIEFDSISVHDVAPRIAFEGGNFLVVSVCRSPDLIHAVRVSADGAEIPPSAGGIAPAYVQQGFGATFEKPDVARLGDRTLIVWQSAGWGGPADNAIVGALAFPRREEPTLPKAESR